MVFVARFNNGKALRTAVSWRQNDALSEASWDNFKSVKTFRSDPNIREYDHIRQIIDIFKGHGIPLTMTLQELRVLNAMTLCFIEHDPVTQSEIVEITGLSKATVCRYVLNWMNLGWLSECIDLKDRRLRPLSLTAFAKETSKSLTAALAAIT